MATQYAATSFQHDDYKVQREFERVARQVSQISSIQAQGSTLGGSGGQSIGTDTKPNGGDEIIQIGTEKEDWALTVFRDSLPVNPTKVVQGLNFERTEVSRAEHSTVYAIPIEFEVRHQLPLYKWFKTRANAAELSISAMAYTQFLDWYNLLPKGVMSIQVKAFESNGSTYITQEGIFKGMEHQQVNLVGDEIDPGPDKVYGTDVNGNKGWQDHTHISADKYYFHEQLIANTTWVVNHNLGRKPNVSQLDSTKTEIYGVVEHLGENILLIQFKYATAGSAICT